MVLTYSCALLALTLCATPPSLGSAKTAAGYRAAAVLQRQQQHQRQHGRLGAKEGEEGGLPSPLLEHPAAAATPAAHIRRRDKNSWWWGGRGGLGRVRAAACNGRCAAKLTGRETAAAADGSRSAGLEAALGLARGGGGGGGYNYDDDYYGGAEGGGGDDQIGRAHGGGGGGGGGGGRWLGGG
ncbi:unnamed protein product [Ectocarpus fasciculatus]